MFTNAVKIKILNTSLHKWSVRRHLSLHISQFKTITYWLCEVFGSIWISQNQNYTVWIVWDLFVWGFFVCLGGFCCCCFSVFKHNKLLTELNQVWHILNYKSILISFISMKPELWDHQIGSIFKIREYQDFKDCYSALIGNFWKNGTRPPVRVLLK